MKKTEEILVDILLTFPVVFVSDPWSVFLGFYIQIHDKYGSPERQYCGVHKSTSIKKLSNYFTIRALIIFLE